MKIGEFSRRLGVTPPTVRFYEDLGLIPRARRASGARLYDEQSLERLRVVLALKAAGFTLVEIRALLASLATGASRELWQTTAREKLAELGQQIAALSRARATLQQALDCDCQGHAERCALLAATPHPGERQALRRARRSSPPTQTEARARSSRSGRRAPG